MHVAAMLRPRQRVRVVRERARRRTRGVPLSHRQTTRQGALEASTDPVHVLIACIPIEVPRIHLH
eukprot:COSAG02_NODE_63117_length_264_cov_0.618182_1_plen_64_part_01